jgi:hypothetical protein
MEHRFQNLSFSRECSRYDADEKRQRPRTQVGQQVNVVAGFSLRLPKLWRVLLYQESVSNGGSFSRRFAFSPLRVPVALWFHIVAADLTRCGQGGNFTAQTKTTDADDVGRGTMVSEVASQDDWHRAVLAFCGRRNYLRFE